MSDTSSPVRPSVLVAHPSRERYGSDRQCLESVVGLVEAGWRVVVALPPAGHGAGSGDLSDDLRAAGAEVLDAAAPVLRKSALSPRGLVALAGQSLACLPALVGLVRRERPAAVYVSTLTAPLWLLASRLAGRAPLAHVHEAEESVPRVVRALLVAPLLLAPVVLVNSAASRDVLGRSLPGLQRRARVLHNGVPGPPEVAPLREALDDGVRLVLVGRLSPRKGTDVAVAAVAELARRDRRARLELVGAVFEGYEWYERQLREQVTAAGLDGAVGFSGLAASPWPALARADVALVPSRVEPFGNTAVEAMLAGRPVVASATQGLVEVVRDGVDGVLVPPDDPVALADAVEDLVDGWAAARARADEARSAAASRFSLDGYRRAVAAAVHDASAAGRDRSTG